MTTAYKFQIGLIIFPGLTNLDTAGPLDVMGRFPDSQVHLIAKEMTPVISDIGMPVAPTIRMADAPALDLVFIGGGPGTTALLEDDQTLEFLADRGPKAQWVTSVCTGALVLGAAGLLRGYRAATHWSAMDILPVFGAEPVHERVVIDRNRITGGGVTAGIDFGLVLAGLLHGEAFARRAELGMEYDPHPPHGCGSPALAPPELVAEIRRAMQPMTDARRERAERAAKRFSPS